MIAALEALDAALHVSSVHKSCEGWGRGATKSGATFTTQSVDVRELCTDQGNNTKFLGILHEVKILGNVIEIMGTYLWMFCGCRRLSEVCLVF